MSSPSVIALYGTFIVAVPAVSLKTKTSQTMNKNIPPPAKDYEELCAFCESKNVSPAPYYQVGKGNAYRTLEPEVFCLRCGKVAPPTLVISTKN